MINKEIKIISEIASAHCGSIEKLIQLIESANSSGCDFIKLQVFNYNELINIKSKKFLMLKDIEISSDNWKIIFDYCSKKKINLIAEPFDLKSLELVHQFSDIKAIKIPTSDLGDWDYINLVCNFANFVIIGVGGATTEEINDITSYLKQYKGIETILMHGFQNFPTQLEDLQLAKITWIRETFNLKVGFADHINADFKELARTIPCMAMSLGAEYIEKHITLNRSNKEYDYYSALNPDEFKTFVAFIKNSFNAIGLANNNVLSDAEKKYRNQMKKFAVLKENVFKGQVLTNINVDFRRVDEIGLTRNGFEKFNEKKINNNYDSGTILTEKSFE